MTIDHSLPKWKTAYKRATRCRRAPLSSAGSLGSSPISLFQRPRLALAARSRGPDQIWPYTISVLMPTNRRLMDTPPEADTAENAPHDRAAGHSPRRPKLSWAGRYRDLFMGPAVKPPAGSDRVRAHSVPSSVRPPAIPLGCMAQPDEIARAAVFLASDKAGVVTGQTLHVN